MYLRDLMDVGEYNRLVEEGYINRRKHPEFDLWISNYSKTAQFEQKWVKPVLLSRGLITDSRDRIIARPWEKFFNLGEQNMEVQPDQPVEVMDKVDGSLGILYPAPDGTYAIATRGSFDSPQARHATALWKNKYATYLDSTLHDADSFAGRLTFLFEIVYPENQIVLDYGDQDDLVLLGAVEIDTGYYYGPREAKAFLGWFGPVVEVFDYKTISEALSHTNRDNAEGFIIKSHNYLVKIKQPDYLEKHKLRFELTPRRVWENLVAGKNLVEIVAPLPDEFQREILSIATSLQEQFSRVQSEIAFEYQAAINTVGLDASKKDFAALAVRSKYKAALFLLFENRSIEKWIWDRIRPVGEKSDTSNTNAE